MDVATEPVAVPLAQPGRDPIHAEPAIAPAAETSRLDRIHRLSIDRYNRMIDAGIFGSKEPIFLWKGRLVEKTTKTSPHDVAVSVLTRLFIRLIPEGWSLRVERSLELPDESVPEPDLVIVRGVESDYIARHPRAADAILVVEVSDSSLREDQGEVLAAYAEALIPNYWIVNIPGRRFEVHADPTGPSESPGYRSVSHHPIDDHVPLVLDGRDVGRIAVAEVLP